MYLPEIIAVGIYNSQNVVKSLTVSRQRETTRFEIELPMEDGGISYIGSGASPIRPHTLICAKPGQLRHTKFPYKCYFLHITIPNGSLHEALTNTPDFIQTDRYDHYRRIFTRLIHYHHTAGDNLIIQQSLVLELIHLLRQDGARLARLAEGKNSHDSLVEKAVSYIKADLTQDLCLEQVADYVSLSPIHFHNRFKTAMGITLREYVEQQRIKKAIDLLMTTDWSLTQIAFESGFSSQSYFSFVFKRKMGLTPREYIQEMYRKYET